VAASSLLLVSTAATAVALLVGAASGLAVAAIAAVVLAWGAVHLGAEELADERRRHAEERAELARDFRALFLERSAEHAHFAARMRERLLAAERLDTHLRGILRLAEARGDEAEDRVVRLEAELAGRRPELVDDLAAWEIVGVAADTVADLLAWEERAGSATVVEQRRPA
jgi:hypothetical protein